MIAAWKRPLRWSLHGVIVAVGMATLLPGYAAGAETRASTPARTVFIVTCRCDTTADRRRIAKAVRRQGGSLVYMYDTMPGLAVASPRGSNADRFMARLLRIPNVTDVRVSEARQLQSTAG